MAYLSTLLLQSYFLVAAIFMHISIFVCTESTCPLLPGTFFQIMPQSLFTMANGIFTHIPLPLYLIRIIAQFLIIGDVIFLILVCIRILTFFISRIFSVILYIALFVAVAYFVTSAIDHGHLWPDSFKQFSNQVRVFFSNLSGKRGQL